MTRAHFYKGTLNEDIAAYEKELEELLSKPTTDIWKRDEIRIILVSLQISAYSMFIPASGYNDEDVLQVKEFLFKGVPTRNKKLKVMKSTHKRVLDFINKHQDVMDKYEVFEK